MRRLIMKRFKITTDTEEIILEAETKLDAEMQFVRDNYPEKLDDELSDLYDIEEIKGDV